MDASVEPPASNAVGLFVVASARVSVGVSVGFSVGAGRRLASPSASGAKSLGACVGDVEESVGASSIDTVGLSIGESVGRSICESVGESVG